jgi:hypothetical protein
VPHDVQLPDEELVDDALLVALVDDALLVAFVDDTLLVASVDDALLVEPEDALLVPFVTAPPPSPVVLALVEPVAAPPAPVEPDFVASTTVPVQATTEIMVEMATANAGSPRCVVRVCMNVPAPSLLDRGRLAAHARRVRRRARTSRTAQRSREAAFFVAHLGLPCHLEA